MCAFQYRSSLFDRSEALTESKTQIFGRLFVGPAEAWKLVAYVGSRNAATRRNQQSNLVHDAAPWQCAGRWWHAAQRITSPSYSNT